jgi:hypothetical protein
MVWEKRRLTRLVFAFLQEAPEIMKLQIFFEISMEFIVGA